MPWLLTLPGHQQTWYQGSPFHTARRPGASKTTSRASGFEQIFPFHSSRSKTFKILEVRQVMILRKGKPWVLTFLTSKVQIIPSVEAGMLHSNSSNTLPPAAPYNTWNSVLVQDLTKSWIHETGCYKAHIISKFEKKLSHTAQMAVKFSELSWETPNSCLKNLMTSQWVSARKMSLHC